MSPQPQFEKTLNKQILRMELKIKGSVQGVGFRPFIFNLAKNLRLTGWVNNSTEGILIEIEGKKENLQTFITQLKEEKPQQSVIRSIEKSYLSPLGSSGFEIKNSVTLTEKNTLMLPDIATCNVCLKEIFNPANRRYLYPFTTCTECGPRFSIIEALPFDRLNTTMKEFKMCEECRSEYETPADRRFHA